MDTANISYRGGLDPNWRSQLMATKPSAFTESGEFRGDESLLDPYRTYEVVYKEPGQPKQVLRTGRGDVKDVRPKQPVRKYTPGVFSQGPTILRPAPKGFKAPKEQFRSGGGAKLTGSSMSQPLTRSQLMQSLAYQQQISSEGREYYASAQKMVLESPARSPVRRDLFRERGPSAVSPYSYEKNEATGEVKLFVTPMKVEKKDYFANVPKPIKEFSKGGYSAIKLGGYVAGEPYRVLGVNLEKGGTYLEKRADRIENPIIREFQKKPATAIKYSGQYFKGYGEGWVERPGTTLLYLGVFGALSFGLSTVSLGTSKLPKILPTSVKTKTSQIIAGGLVGLYAYTTAKRVLASDEPYRTAGRITSTELVPAIGGSILGEAAFLKTQGWIRSFGAKEIPIEKLVPKEVLSGKQNFPTAEPQKHLQMFKEGKYSIKKGEDIYYPHATPALFGKKFVTQAGARPKEAAGLYVSGKGASVYFLRIGSGDVTYYPKSILPEAVTPTLVYVKPSKVVAMPSVLKSGYGKNTAAYTWFSTKAVKDVAYVPGVKSEVEAVIPPGSLFRQTKDYGKYFTNVKGVDVPVKLYNPRAKISTRQYFYPEEDIAVRVPRYYYPKESYNVPASTYGLLSLTRTSSKVSSVVSSVVKGSKTSSLASSKISSGYTPYIPKSITTYTKYSVITPKSVVSSSMRYRGGSYVGGSISGISPVPPISYGPSVAPPIRIPPTYSTPPIRLDLDFTPGGMKSKSYKQLRRPFKQQASVTAVIKGIKEKKAKKMLSGIEVRPIPKR